MQETDETKLMELIQSLSDDYKTQSKDLIIPRTRLIRRKKDPSDMYN